MVWMRPRLCAEVKYDRSAKGRGSGIQLTYRSYNKTERMDAGEVMHRSKIRQGGSQQQQHAPAVEALGDDGEAILGFEPSTERNKSEVYVWWGCDGYLDSLHRFR